MVYPRKEFILFLYICIRFYNFCTIKVAKLNGIKWQIKFNLCFFISVSDEFKMLVSGEAKASVDKFLEDDHSFEEYTNVSNIYDNLLWFF